MHNIKVDLTKKVGKLKPVHGITNGPLCNAGMWDGSKYYKEIGIPFVRLHDTDGNRSCTHVDIHRIFPDFDADIDDEKNYWFLETDAYIKAIMDTGAEVIYRLGESIEQNDVLRRYAKPPKDFDRWAEICIRIIKHYTQGWANGFSYSMKYWEIWNEPDLTGSMWDGGTNELYYELYRVASAKIKAFNPDLLVGGPTACDPSSTFIEDFVAYCRKNDLTIDFLSYHIYTGSIYTVVEIVNKVRNILDKYGYNKAITIVDEWNYFGSEVTEYGELWGKLRSVDGAVETTKLCKEQQGTLGAAFVIGCFIAMNQNPLDIATYYDGQYFLKFCGLFDPYGGITKTYHAFRGYGMMYKNAKTTVDTISDTEGIYALASSENDESYVIISNFGGDSDYYTVDINGLNGETTAEVYLINEERNLDLYKTEIYHGNRVKQSIFMENKSVALIKLVNCKD